MPYNFRGANALFSNLLANQIQQKQDRQREQRLNENTLLEEDRELKRRIAEEDRQAIRGDIVFDKTTERATKVAQAAGAADIELESLKIKNKEDIARTELETETGQNLLYSTNIQQRADRNGVPVNIPPNADRKLLEAIDQNLDQAITGKRIESSPSFLPTAVFNEVDNQLVREFGSFLTDTFINYTPENVYTALSPQLKQQWDARRTSMIEQAKRTGSVTQTQTPIRIESPEVAGPPEPGGVPSNAVQVGVDRTTGKPVYRLPNGDLWRN